MEIVVAILGSSALAAVISGLFSRIDRKQEKDDAVQLLLYHDIKVECREYIFQGYIGSDELEVLMKMHETYHNRGGNGYLDKLVQEACELPVKEERTSNEFH